MEYVAAEAKLRAALRAILDQLDRYGCVYAESDTAAEARALLDGYDEPRPPEHVCDEWCQVCAERPCDHAYENVVARNQDPRR